MCKVVFISKNTQKELNGIKMEYGDIYTVDVSTDFQHYIRNVYGGHNSYLKQDFISLDKWRDIQLGKLLNQ